MSILITMSHICDCESFIKVGGVKKKIQTFNIYHKESYFWMNQRSSHCFLLEHLVPL